MKLFLSLALVSFVLVGCGQKGPLYKTPAKIPNQTATAAPPQPSE